MAGGCGIMLLHSPGGSTLQWSMGRGLLCLTIRTFVYGTKITETPLQWRWMMGWDCLPSIELVLEQVGGLEFTL